MSQQVIKYSTLSYGRCSPILRKGLAERRVRAYLEQQGWQVWRGGLLHVSPESMFPSPQKKYALLFMLLYYYSPDKSDLLLFYSFQAGMPDFLCFRNKQFRFVECKLDHEQLSSRQERCFLRLQQAGFLVEVIKVVSSKVRWRRMTLVLPERKRKIMEVQKRLLAFPGSVPKSYKLSNERIYLRTELIDSPP